MKPSRPPGFSRLQADLLLLVAAAIWGTAFVAQKTAMDGMGPFAFVAARFLLSMLVVLPLALREWRRPEEERAKIPVWPMAFLCLVFTAGALSQQLGISSTSVTNAGFITGLYVVFTPVAVWLLFRQRPGFFIIPGCALAVLGLWLINGAGFTPLGKGDALVLLCAVFFGIHLALLGDIMSRSGRPFAVAALQYGVCGALALVCALVFEEISLQALLESAPAIFYAGAISGGIAYTMQCVAQQYTPSSDAAIILAGEAVFAALAGVLLLGESAGLPVWGGGGLILAAILLIEGGPLLRRRIGYKIRS